MLKIIHTADWHIGKMLDRFSRKEEHEFFFNWLLQFIENQNIDVLLVAGDIFDRSNPDPISLEIYQNFLAKAIRLNIEIVIVGGNHDSAARLNSAKALFKYLNIHIIGGEGNIGELIPIKNKQGEIELVIAAVPFLRDVDIRNILPTEHINRSKNSFVKAAKKHYDDLLALSKEKYPGIQVVTTGHLTIHGCKPSDSTKPNYHKEIGGVDSLATDIFSKEFLYVALGHIHRPQTLEHRENLQVRYSGSPITLTFTEKNDIKEITLLTIENQQLNWESIQVPQIRLFKTIKGTKEQIFKQIDELKNETVQQLPIFLEVLVAQDYNPNDFKIELEELQSQNNFDLMSIGYDPEYKLVKKINFKDSILETENVEDITSTEFILKVFDKKYRDENSLEEGNESLEQIEELDSYKELLTQIIEKVKEINSL